MPRQAATDSPDHREYGFQVVKCYLRVEYRSNEFVTAFHIAREVARKRSLPTAECDWEIADVMDYERLHGFPNSLCFGTISVKVHAMCITIDRKLGVRAYCILMKRMW